MSHIATVSKFLTVSALVFSFAGRAEEVATQPVAPCQSNTEFQPWLRGVVTEAMAAGASQAAVQKSLPYLTYDQSVVRKDSAQGVFYQDFLRFSDRMASADRLRRGPQMIRTYSALFTKIEKDYGIPPEVLVAFWGLESDFGADKGKYPILRAVTTLAYDCRRADFFRKQLIDAIRIVDRGDLAPEQMLGDWAGELGGLQITPSDYFNYAVDYDGDGRRDLVNSIPDTLASGANFLAHLGWQRGQPWLQEVRVPNNMPWDQADLEIQLPRSQWGAWGVRTVDGSALPNDSLKAALLLPMGHLGPAFLAYPNFINAYLGWNASLNYSITAGYLATRISPTAPTAPLFRGNGTVSPLSGQQLQELQQLLFNRGFSQDQKFDGRLGLSTRAAVRKAQVALRMPADSYPTLELLSRLQSGR